MAAIVWWQLRQRRILRRERVFRDRSNPLDKFDDVELVSKFRFRRHDIITLTNAVDRQLELCDRQGVLPPLLQVCLTLRFYATGTFQDVCGELINVSQPTACRTIHRVTHAMLGLVPEWIQFPDQREAEKQKGKFYSMAGFPGVVGCVDGTHIPIQAPIENEHEYVNRKNVHSINVQIICDADLMITDVVAKWPGSVHDARMLRESGLFAAMEGAGRPVKGYLLGDSGYMLRTWLLTPLLNPMTRQERNYNFRHSSTRSAVERTIGLVKKRWHCLRRLRLAPGKACDVITVCCMLHNRARRLSLPDPDSDSDSSSSDSDDSDDDIDNTATERARTVAGKAERQRLINTYF